MLEVSVAGCLGYDVLEKNNQSIKLEYAVSVAGCLGYDVLGLAWLAQPAQSWFQLLVV